MVVVVVGGTKVVVAVVVGGAKVVVVVVGLFAQVSLLKVLPTGRFLAKQNLPLELENTGKLGRHTWNNFHLLPGHLLQSAMCLLEMKLHLIWVGGESLNFVKCSLHVHRLSWFQIRL